MMSHDGRHEASLGNGARAVVEHTEGPWASLCAVWRIGYRDETSPALQGLAHLYEHLMFRASAEQVDLEDAILGAGGDLSARTRRDYTLFSTRVPADMLHMAIRLEGMRASAVADEAWIRTQRAVIGHEVTEKLRGDFSRTVPWAWVGRSLYKDFALGHDGWLSTPSPDVDQGVVAAWCERYTSDRLVWSVVCYQAERDALLNGLESVPLRPYTRRTLVGERGASPVPSTPMLRGARYFAAALPMGLSLQAVLGVQVILDELMAAGAVSGAMVGEYGENHWGTDPFAIVLDLGRDASAPAADAVVSIYSALGFGLESLAAAIGARYAYEQSGDGRDVIDRASTNGLLASFWGESWRHEIDGSGLGLAAREALECVSYLDWRAIES